MFNFLKKDPVLRLEKEYEKILKESVAAQRNGKLELYAELMDQANKISDKIEELKKEKSK